ncbi:MAG: type II secretion system GspH family protein [Opitutales bacterium]|nr:type II secretion system GspH family protein [Opitutales bacterium]
MRNPYAKVHPQTGFTLVELIVALLLVGVLSAILLPVFSYTFRESANYTDQLATKYQLRSALDELRAQGHPEVYLGLDEENAFDLGYLTFIENEIIFSDAVVQNDHLLETRWMAFAEDPSGQLSLVPASPPPYAVLEVEMTLQEHTLTTWFFNPEPEEEE